MTPEIEFQQVDEVPCDSRVCHYDELEPRAKEQFSILIKRDASSVGEDTVKGFSCCDIIKFTDYYRISVNWSDSLQ